MNCFVCIFLLTKRQKFGVVCHLFLGLNAVLNKYEIPNFDSICNVATLLLSCLQCGSLLVFDECILMFYLFIHFLLSEAWSGPQKCFTWFCKKKFLPNFFSTGAFVSQSCCTFLANLIFWSKKWMSEKNLAEKNLAGFFNIIFRYKINSVFFGTV